jgi:phage/plasmid-like protein (TIGR03299 family)
MARWRDTAEMRGKVRRHMIDQTTGKAAVFVVGEPPWHGLGITIANAVTAAEAIKLAGLDWKVEKWRLMAQLGAKGTDGAALEVPNWFATVRTDTNAVLGVVSSQYKVLQNVEAFAFMDQAIKEGAAMWETAGSLQDGRRVWMLARIPQTVEVIKGDEVKPYALLCNGHDGGLAVHILPTTERVCCNNTLNLALNLVGGKELVIRHSQSLKGKIEIAKRHLGIIGQRVGEFGKQARALARVSMKGTEVTGYVEKFFPTKVKPNFTDGAALLSQIVNGKQDRSSVVSDLLAGHYAETERITKRNQGILDQIITNYENDPARGTAWGAYNAVSQYADHQKKYESADTRLNSAWFGAGNDLKQEAYTAALALAA